MCVRFGPKRCRRQREDGTKRAHVLEELLKQRPWGRAEEHPGGGDEHGSRECRLQAWASTGAAQAGRGRCLACHGEHLCPHPCVTRLSVQGLG